MPKANPAATTASISSTDGSDKAEKHLGGATPNLDLERVGETQGYVLDEAQLKEQLGLAPGVSLKKSKKGTVLIPQPSADPQDPLNWPSWKKAAILVVIGVNACTADYSAATGGSALLPQAQEWHISPDEVNHATAGFVPSCQML
jgi:hypothetical protein